MFDMAVFIINDLSKRVRGSINLPQFSSEDVTSEQSVYHPYNLIGNLH